MWFYLTVTAFGRLLVLQYAGARIGLALPRCLAGAASTAA